ncbi:MAG: hypothetical protein AB7M05_05525 [Alphaproteobacteria bacterium]
MVRFRRTIRAELALLILGVTGGDRYQFAFVPMPYSGKWQVRVDMLVSDFEKAIFRFQVDVPEGGPECGPWSALDSGFFRPLEFNRQKIEVINY